MSKTHKVGQLSSVSLLLIYSGAAISIAEIMTGAILAPLGFSKGVTVVILGHMIGGFFLYLAAIMGSRMRKPAMECTRYSFGRYGSYLFSSCNILQLIGWTSIMMIQGSAVFDQIAQMLYGYSNPLLWTIIIAIGISVWLTLLSRHFSTVNSTVVLLLLLLCIIIAFRVSHTVSGSIESSDIQSISFWQGVELNVAMCLSWLPLIADYTQKATSKYVAPAWAVIGYSLVGSGMFILGLLLKMNTEVPDIATMLVHMGFTVVALFIVLFSTVTTTFLDLYSACDSFVNIYPTKKRYLVSLVLCAISLLCALLFPMENIEPFLYGIGSLFAPLYAILFTDYFILRRSSVEKQRWDVRNIILWILGFCLYHLLQRVFPHGSSSLLIVLCVSIGTIITHQIPLGKSHEKH